MAAATSVPKVGTSPFAHLAKGKNKAEDDEDKKKDDAKAEDEKDEDKDKAEDDEDKKKDDAKAEDDKDEDKEKAVDDEGDDSVDNDEKDKKSKKSKKAKSEEGDDESDGEDEADAKSKSIRARERGRILAIMTSDAGLANPEAAARLATKTALPRSEVIAMLHAVGPSAAKGARSDNLRNRMANTDQPKIGTDDAAAPAAGTPAAMALAIINAGKKRRGEV
jgi:hypothetical protein